MTTFAVSELKTSRETGVLFSPQGANDGIWTAYNFGRFNPFASVRLVC